MMVTENEHKKNFFVNMVEIKKAIRDCIQKGGDLKNVESKYGIKFVKPF